jgi:hypothetical protein
MRRSLIGLAFALAAVVSEPIQGHAAVFGDARSTKVESSVVAAQYWRGGPRYGWRGRPYWYARPWARRPYYGRIVAGVALGTLITVAVVGAVPHRPASDLCWYWADPYRNRGYWDYCY